MANITLPSYSGTSLLPALTESTTELASGSTSGSASASEAIRLSSVYYASISVAGANGFVTAEGALPTATPSPQVAAAAAAAGTGPGPSSPSTGEARQTRHMIASMAMLVACGTAILLA